MEYRNRITSEVHSLSGLQSAFPETFIGGTPTSEYLDPLGIDVVENSAAPETTTYQSAARNGVELVAGVWKKAWLVVDWDQPSIDAHKVTAIEAKGTDIKAKRDSLRFDGGVLFGTNWFLSTGIATSEYNSLLLIAAGLPDTTVLRAAWRTMDGATVNMTPALAKSILSAGLTQVAAIDDVAQAHIAAMILLEYPDSYDFSTGWPATFTG